VDGRAIRLGEHQTLVAVVGADRQPLGRLGLAVGAQDRDRLRWQGDGAPPLGRLGLPEHHQVTAGVPGVGVDVADRREGLADRDPVGVQVGVAPAQAQDLAAAHAGGGRQQDRRM
jgi:hypothetical protein